MLLKMLRKKKKSLLLSSGCITLVKGPPFICVPVAFFCSTLMVLELLLFA